MRITDTAAITPAPDITYPVEIQWYNIITANAKWIKSLIAEMVDEILLDK